jgi:2-desacetyl-2-hydroxyethyl bacteriochlorophyllide A dehydrogenase
MKAAYILDNKVLVGDVPDPVPGKGQALVRTHRCGLCASDVHFLHSAQKAVDLSREYNGPYAALDLTRPFVPGHEFVGEIIDYGPGSKKPIKVGRRVTSMPVMLYTDSRAVIGYDNHCPGGFGEYMLLDEQLMLEIPDALDDNRAAMTEPLAVGLEHARRGNPTKHDVALVLGCGAIGLGVIAGLQLMGIAPIIAADLDDRRRNIALQMGAHIAIDPRELSPYSPIPDLGNRAPNLVYECVGKPGILQQIIKSVAFGSRVVMGGFCMQPEEVLVFSAQMKGLNVQFALGEEPSDMEQSLRAIADGTVDVTPWLGASIGLDKVGQALSEMSDPGSPVRTVVDPRRMRS